MPEQLRSAPLAFVIEPQEVAELEMLKFYGTSPTKLPVKVEDG